MPFCSAKVCGRRLKASPTAETAQTRCGFVRLIGAPNSGKSTLPMRWSAPGFDRHPQAQTTRGPVRGIALIAHRKYPGRYPGHFLPKRRLDRAMSQAAWDRAGDADLVALVIDAQHGLDLSATAAARPSPPSEAADARSPQQGRSCPEARPLAPRRRAVRAHALRSGVHGPALTGDGVGDLKSSSRRGRADRALALPRGPADRRFAPAERG